jgi:hypothetical protein
VRGIGPAESVHSRTGSPTDCRFPEHIIDCILDTGARSGRVTRTLKLRTRRADPARKVCPQGLPARSRLVNCPRKDLRSSRHLHWFRWGRNAGRERCAARRAVVDVPRWPGAGIGSHGFVQRIAPLGSAAFRYGLEDQSEYPRTFAHCRAQPQPGMGRQRRAALPLLRQGLGP